MSSVFINFFDQRFCDLTTHENDSSSCHMNLAEASALMWCHLVANWIWKESTIAAVLDLDKRQRVGARFGEKKSSC